MEAISLEDRIDLLIRGALVVTMDDPGTVFEDGVVGIADGEIAFVGDRDAGAAATAERTIDATAQLLMPGLVNGHVHMGDSLFRSLVEDLPLEPWLERLWVSEREFITHDNVSLGARLALCEMIRSGTTCALDMFWFPEAAADVCIEAGFRLVTGPIFFDFDGPDGVAAEDRIGVGGRWLSRYADESLIVPCVQPHNHLTVSPEGMRAARGLADAHGALFHTHCSETATEVAATRERFGCTPVAHLDALGVLDGPTVLAHCVHLTDDDFALLRDRGSAVLHNPLSNLKLGSGIAPVARMLDEGIPVSIGTDGPVSSNDLDMWTAMRFAGLLQRGAMRNPVLTPARTVVRMVTSGGAAALGLGGTIGSIEPGKRADLILIDLDRPHLVPMFDVYAHLAYAVGRADVRSVLIDGRFVLEDRRLCTLDEASVLADARELGDAIATHAAALSGGGSRST